MISKEKIAAVKGVVSAHRKAVMGKAREECDNFKKARLAELFGCDVGWGSEQADELDEWRRWVSVGPVRIDEIERDQYLNLNCKAAPFPPKDVLGVLCAVIDYFENPSDHPYHNRPVKHFLLAILEQYANRIDKDYLLEMCRVGDEYPEKGETLRTFLAGTPPGPGHLGRTPNLDRYKRGMNPAILRT